MRLLDIPHAAYEVAQQGTKMFDDFNRSINLVVSLFQFSAAYLEDEENQARVTVS